MVVKTRRIAVAASAVLLLAAAAGAQEVRLRPTRALYSDARGGGMKAPEGVDCYGDSLLVVADTGNRRLLRFEKVEGRLTPSGEIRLSQLPYPTHVRFDSGGQILALDGRSHRIVRVDPLGEFRGLVDLTTGTNQEDVLVKSFELDDQDNLYVLDVAGGRILVFASGGSLTRRIAFPREVGFISDLAVGPSGVVFAVDSVARQVFVARGADTALEPLGESLEKDSEFPMAIVADRLGRLFLADQSGGGVLVLQGSGSFAGRQSAMGWREGFLRYPSGLGVAGDQLFVADRGNNRIQVFTIVD